ncbi:MAG: hypothetical protein NTX99_03000 [Candidatus Aminicenantes bacterium]|nr:hypothetical protein [Candidatus Aminicenantes bacterium]
MDITRLRGIGVSPGIAMGEALLPRRVIFTSRKEIVADDQVPDELKRLRQALDRTRSQQSVFLLLFALICFATIFINSKHSAPARQQSVFLLLFFVTTNAKPMWSNIKGIRIVVVLKVDL